ncbi:hypothetical protein H2203_005716 [Taxawa tesnikishii (nom. ined.)]|nr:hypothetical protein H2203_005716 [Dothideales sp. JES 119]
MRFSSSSVVAALVLASAVAAVPAPKSTSTSVSTSHKSTSVTSTTTSTSTKKNAKTTSTKKNAKTTSTTSVVVPSTSAPVSTSSAPVSSTSAPATSLASSTAGTPVSSNVCSVTAYSAIPAATAACTSIILDSIEVPGNQSINLAKLLTGTTVTFKGKTTFDYADADYDMITVGGTDITVTSEPGAIIDGNGQAWWDGQGSNGGLTKPDHFFVVKKAIGNSVIKDLYIQNYPTHCFSISGSNGLVVENIVLNQTAGNAPNARSSGLPAAHNTDGFDISSTNGMTLRDSTVLNQDDCVAITSGDSITVSNMYCDGGHGLSIGSVGGKSNNNVTNILFQDSVVLNSQNGARIKSNFNTTGYIAGITYQNIYIENASIYGIDIQQDYLNGGPTGTPSNGVIITNITMTNVTGTATSGAKDYYILCGDGSCSDFTFNDVHIAGGSGDSCNVETAGDFTCP